MFNYMEQERQLPIQPVNKKHAKPLLGLVALFLAAAFLMGGLGGFLGGIISQTMGNMFFVKESAKEIVKSDGSADSGLQEGFIASLADSVFGTDLNKFKNEIEDLKKEISDIKKNGFGKLKEEESVTIDIVQKASQSVVSIKVTKAFGGFGVQEISRGTGFFVSADGLIVTNRHVAGDFDASYLITTNTGDEYNAVLIDMDTIYDLAVLKINGENPFPYLTFSDEQVKKGQTVIAVGNTLGEYPNTVTRGIVSGIGRTVVAGDGRGSSSQIFGAIQTDAAINQGNSGGPLLNLDGKVVGINTAVSSQGESVAFAIPATEANIVVNSVNKYGRIARPFLGVFARIITPEFARVYGLPKDYGELIFSDDPRIMPVVPASPAEKAGLKAGDIILEVDGVKLTQEVRLPQIIAQKEVGATVTLHIDRDGAEMDIKATLEERQKDTFK